MQGKGYSGGSLSEMRIRTKSLSLIGASVALAMSMAAPAEANHSWGGYHWARTSNPFTLKLGNNVSGTWNQYLNTTRDSWNGSKSTTGSPVVFTVVAGSSGRNCKAVKGTVQVCNANYGFNGWLGVAQIWLTGDHITQGSVKLNDSYFNTATYNTPAWRNLVSCQEVGHTLGLDHQDEVFTNPNLNTCMDYTNNPSTNQFPNQHDYDELWTIYTHLDSTTTVASSTAPGTSGFSLPDDGGAGPSQWGRAVAFTGDGRGRIFELDVGGGKRMITFVTWAPSAPHGPN